MTLVQGTTQHWQTAHTPEPLLIQGVFATALSVGHSDRIAHVTGQTDDRPPRGVTAWHPTPRADAARGSHTHRLAGAAPREPTGWQRPRPACQVWRGRNDRGRPPPPRHRVAVVEPGRACRPRLPASGLDRPLREGEKTSSRSSLSQTLHSTILQPRFPASRPRSLRVYVKRQGTQSPTQGAT